MTEFTEAELGDVRRTQRLIRVATALAQQPGRGCPRRVGAERRSRRRIGCSPMRRSAPAEILASHVVATLERAVRVRGGLGGTRYHGARLAAPPATTGLGPIGHPKHQGLLVHSTLAFTPERVPLGLIAQAVWARDPQEGGAAGDASAAAD